MPQFLPLRADIEWLKKTAKDRLADLRTRDADAKLADAQLTLARDYGFKNWPAMTAHVKQVRDALRSALPILNQSLSDLHSGKEPEPTEVEEFCRAVCAGDPAVIHRMLERSPRLAIATDACGFQPIHLAAQFNDSRAGIMLLAFGADPGIFIRDSRHDALSWAVTCHALDFVRAMIRLGAVPDLFVSAGLGDLDGIKSYFEPTGELIPNASRTGSTRHRKQLEGPALSEERAVDEANAERREHLSDALTIACRNGHFNAAELLLSVGADIEFQGFAGARPLHWAYFSGVPDVVAKLIARGADAEARDTTFLCRPRAFGLIAASAWGLWFKITSLHTAFPDALAAEGEPTTPLHEAAAAGHRGIVEQLLKLGADKARLDARGRTAADRAVEAGDSELAEQLR